MKFLEQHKEWGLVILRLFLGVAFLVAGVNKALGFEMAKGMFATWFGSLGTPMLYLALLLEIGGGLMLLLNWHAHCAAIFLAAMMVVAAAVTWQVDMSSGVLGILQQMFVMNMKSNLPVNFSFIAGLLALAFQGCETCKRKKR